MFRTSNLRGENRFSHITQLKTPKPGKLSLTPQQVKLIEDSQAITLGEKIELLLVTLGNKLTTELFLKIEYTWNQHKEKEVANQKQIEAIETLLSQLPFVYFKDQLPKKNRLTNQPREFVWFQVSITDAVSTFMKEFPDDLTEFEEGVLYGFPLSAIRAFSGLIEPSHEKPTPASYYLAGVCSKDFWEDEQEYYQLWWERLRKVSPKIVKEAERKFVQITL